MIDISVLRAPILEKHNIGAGIGSKESLQNYFDSMASNLTGNVWFCDNEAKGMLCNQAVLDFIGLGSQDGYKNFSMFDYHRLGVMTSDACEIVENRIMNVVETGSIQLHMREPKAQNTKGEVVELITSRFPVYGSAGEVIGIFGNTVGINLLTPNKTTIDLSPRMQEVLRCYNKGFSRNDAADALNISINTYAWYLRQIREKFNIRTREEMLELGQGLR